MADAFADLPEHERLAALTSVQDTFAAADEPDAGRLLALELDPERLRAELSAPAAGLSERAVDLYEDLLGRCCAHLVEQLTTHPSFAARAAVEQVRAAGRTRELVEDVRDRVGPRPDAADLEFERRYAEFVATANGRVELFGLTLGRSAAWVAAGDGLHQPLGQRLRGRRRARSGAAGPDLDRDRAGPR